MISPADLEALVPVPDVAKPTAMWLWLNLDPLGRGRADPNVIAGWMPHLSPETVEEHLIMLLEAGFLTTYMVDGVEWLLLLHPLKVDLRGTRITTPDPPGSLHGLSMAVGGGGRERARERVRAEGAARAAAWDAVREEERPVEPERPMMLDAPPMFCDDHMPNGAGRKKCGPCRDRRLLRDEWVTSKVYEERLTDFYEAGGVDERAW